MKGIKLSVYKLNAQVMIKNLQGMHEKSLSLAPEVRLGRERERRTRMGLEYHWQDRDPRLQGRPRAGTAAPLARGLPP
jgi:hypothetical protein